MLHSRPSRLPAPARSRSFFRCQPAAAAGGVVEPTFLSAPESRAQQAVRDIRPIRPATSSPVWSGSHFPNCPSRCPRCRPPADSATYGPVAQRRTAQACSDLAESVRRQLPTGHSAVVAFTSPGDDDGKSGLLISFAPELARLSPGGLLVADADFHCAELTSRLSISRGQTGGTSPLIYSTNFPGLSVLPIPTAIRADGRQGAAFSNSLTVRINPAWIDRWRADWPLVLLDAVSLRHAEAWPMLSALRRRVPGRLHRTDEAPSPASGRLRLSRPRRPTARLRGHVAYRTGKLAGS